MTNELIKEFTGDILEEDVEMSTAELCRACELSAEQVFELVEYGVVEPLDSRPEHWRFLGICVRRVHRAKRLQRDLGVNLAGAALALDLLDELEHLRERVKRYENSATTEL